MAASVGCSDVENFGKKPAVHVILYISHLYGEHIGMRNPAAADASSF